MKNIKQIVTSIKKGLELIGNEARAEAKNNYLKHVVKHRGIQNPNVYAFTKEEINKEIFTKLDHADQLKVAEELLKSEYGEDKLASITIYEKICKEFSQSDIDSIKQLIIDGHVQEWATCDTLSRPIRNWTLLSEENTRYIAEWSKEVDCLWVRRCCCVSQVTRAKKGDKGNFKGYLDILFEISGRVIQYDQRFNQLGVGWLLREMYLADKKRTISFIETNYDSFIKEGLRYAIEKMTSPEQKRLLNFKQKNSEEENQKGIKKAQPKKK